MAVPPSYSDLGKKARDLFSKGFNYGFFKLETKTKSSKGIEFTVNGSSCTESGKVNGSLETKYKCSDYGMTFTEKWNTDNVLTAEVAIEDQLVQGSKLTFDTSFAPSSGKKSGKVKMAYKQDYLNLNTDVDFNFGGPVVNGACVAGYNGFLAGYEMSFDTAKSQLTKNNFAAGYDAGDLVLHTNVNDGQEFGGAVYHKARKDLEIGVAMSWGSGNPATHFALGGKYVLDDQTTLVGKINNSSQIGMSLQHQLRDGIKLTLSGLINAKNLEQGGGHKFGIGLDLEA